MHRRTVLSVREKIYASFKDICYGSRDSSEFTYLLHDVFVINVTNDVINYDYVIRIHS